MEDFLAEGDEGLGQLLRGKRPGGWRGIAVLPSSVRVKENFRGLRRILLLRLR